MEYLTKEKIQSIIEEVVNKYLIPHFLEKGMDASGEWKKSVNVVDDTIRGRKYTEQLVYGRSPGTFAPIQPLKEWAMIKLGLEESQALSAAFAISNKLKQEGNEYYKQGGTDLIEILKSKEVIEYINTETKNFIEIQIDLELKRQIKEVFK